MSNKPNLSKDGSFIDFKQSDNVPTTAKKFRQSPEIQGFYSFVYDNGLQAEAFDILTLILERRRAQRLQETGSAAEAPAKAKRGKAVAKAAEPKAAKVAAPKAAKAAAAKPAKKKPVAAKKPVAKKK